MTTCPICDYRYSERRTHCPTCGSAITVFGTVVDYTRTHTVRCANAWQYTNVVVAYGAERASQNLYANHSPRQAK